MEVSRTAYIVGASMDIEPLREGALGKVKRPLVDATVLIATFTGGGSKLKFCSGTLVAPENDGGKLRVLSNHHCFATMDADGKATPTLLPEACSSTKIYLGFLPEQSGGAFQAACQTGSLRTDFAGDISIFTVDREVPGSYRPLSLWQQVDNPTGRRAVVLHYPDVPENAEAPRGLTIKLPTAAITTNDCRVLGEFAAAEWELDRALPFGLRHSCDLIHGSSGSALIDEESGTILGVNWGGIKISYAEGDRTDNVATKASYVAAFIDNRLSDEVKTVAARFAGGAAKDSDATKAASKEPTGGVKTISCGVIAGPASAARWILCLPLFIVLGPASALGRRARRWLLALAMSLAAVATGRGPALAQATTTAAAAPAGTATLSAEPRWAAALLLELALAHDFLASLKLGTDGQWTKDACAGDVRERLLPRAVFAAAAAMGSGHQLGLDADLAKAYALCGAVPAPAADLNALAATFAAPRERENFLALASTLPGASWSCPIDGAEVIAFASWQKDKLARGSLPKAAEVKERLASFSDYKKKCLVLALFKASEGAKQETGFEPWPLLMSLSAEAYASMEPLTLATLKAARLLQLGNYPESLRLVFALAEAQPEWRLVYELVQRIYAQRQMGQGKVALRGL